MDDAARFLTLLGGVLLLGLGTDALGRRTRLPRVTLLLLLGFGVGPSGLDLFSPEREPWAPTAADVALVMLGFLLGGQFTRGSLRRHGRLVLGISLGVVLTTVLCVSIGLVLLGVDPALALLLGGVATATDPAAIVDVVQQTGARSRFARVLLGIVAIDDAWGLVAFSLILAGAIALTGGVGSASALGFGLRHVGGAIVLGALLGVPAAFVTGRVDPGEPTLLEALGVVLLCGGLALALDVSFLLASMVLGTVVANLARHHTRPFHAIENVERPFLILFFVLAGASLDWRASLQLGGLASAYVALRVAGRLAGAWLGGRLSGAERPVRRWMGPALLPQAGVAIGMALVAAEHLPELRDVILPVVVGTTVLFELAGPVLTHVALSRAG